MQTFFGDVDIIKNIIHSIKDATKRISDINQEVALSATSDSTSANDDLGNIISTTNKKAQNAKLMLKNMQDELAALKKNEDTKQSELRIRENLANTLTRKFVEVMKDYQNSQTKYKTDIKKRVKRQVQIVKPDATSEEIDAVLKSNKGSGEIFKSAILKVGKLVFMMGCVGIVVVVIYLFIHLFIYLFICVFTYILTHIY